GAEVGAALSGEAEERAFFAPLPDGLAAWTAAERALFLAAARALAAASPRHARIVYRELPPATAKLPAEVRAALLRALARIDPGLAAPLAELTPVAGAVLAEVPPAERLAALALVEEVAAAHSEAAVAALRVLPRLYEEASPAAIRRWFAAGAAVAAEHADLRACVRRTELLEDLYLLAEGVRVHHRLAASYPGLAGEMRVLGSRLLERWGREPAPSRTVVLDALLLLALGARPRPAWLAADAARLVARLVAPLAAPGATVEDALAVARVLAAALDAPALALPAAEPEALRQALGDAEPAAARRAPVPANHDHAFFYDEWDHLIGDYRSRWCRLTEVGLAGDAGEFFGQTLADYARLLPEVRRQFQRIRPEMYRAIRGLEDGEDFDLNSTIDARIDVRARRAPSTRLYRSRVREARDVATLFLLDMSASTDEPLAPAGADS